MKCPYCARPLRKGGLRCRACRRYVPRWPHLLVLSILALAAIIVLLEIIHRLALETVVKP